MICCLYNKIKIISEFEIGISTHKHDRFSFLLCSNFNEICFEHLNKFFFYFWICIISVILINWFSQYFQCWPLIYFLCYLEFWAFSLSFLWVTFFVDTFLFKSIALYLKITASRQPAHVMLSGGGTHSFFPYINVFRISEVT